MNLSPSAVLESLAPWMLIGTAVTLALILAVLVALFGVPYFLLRFRRHQEDAGEASGAAEASAPGGIGGFTWSSAQDEDRRAG
ncbi:hypothetical protein ACFYYB_04130 [Streptomyces sp. NPDC002886]|uniref:hypothetical protein n=1 Tax=Streptomyces sp. NPDC002886 TaxID=3364667 RepID=UPI0036BEB919